MVWLLAFTPGDEAELGVGPRPGFRLRGVLHGSRVGEEGGPGGAFAGVGALRADTQPPALGWETVTPGVGELRFSEQIAGAGDLPAQGVGAGGGDVVADLEVVAYLLEFGLHACVPSSGGLGKFVLGDVVEDVELRGMQGAGTDSAATGVAAVAAVRHVAVRVGAVVVAGVGFFAVPTGAGPVSRLREDAMLTGQPMGNGFAGAGER
ncbi:hypothetical protein ACIBBE_24085 [Streptomyces sp. NPDC051644]|uniref:hypothetical protein n=1 Tax=Streptomyces sp. NPDC051644 TaxID=3365666 RepID=UPI00378D36C7